MLLLMTLLMGWTYLLPKFSDLNASTLNEDYEFEYLVLLFESGDDASALKESIRFDLKFPDSEYSIYSKYIQADIHLRQGNYQSSSLEYDQILGSPERFNAGSLYPLEFKAQVLLDNAFTKYKLKNFTEAEILIQRYQSELDFESYNHRAFFLRGLIQVEKGLYYSAEQSFHQSLIAKDSKDAQFELFKVLLKLEKEQLAKDILVTVTPGEALYRDYILYWLAFLEENSRFIEFDEVVSHIPDEHLSNDIKLLIVRNAIRQDNFNKAKDYLSTIATTTDYSRFYNALILKNDGHKATADSMFSSLKNSKLPDIAILSYLEQVKILFIQNAQSAINQLRDFVRNSPTKLYYGEQLFLLGYLNYLSQDYEEAMKYLALAKAESIDYNSLDRINFLISDIWYKIGKEEQALQSYNRYLNLHPYGQFRSQTWFTLGLIYVNRKNYSLAKAHFNRMIEEHPNAINIWDARFYVAEIDFNLANYTQALSEYETLLEADPANPRVLYRISQTYYYTRNYTQALEVLDKIVTEDLNFDHHILRGGILFNEKKYSEALQVYQAAEDLVADTLKQREAQSYRALTLFQLRRFKEASDLYFALSGSRGSEDTYLYLSAKSAFHANDYHQALKIYEQFLERFPDSNYYLRVLNDIANVYYNLGNYNSATQTWINTIRRFMNSSPLKADEQTFVQEILVGLELGFKQGAELTLAEELIGLIDSFKSEYLRFELRFLVVKVYADKSLWQALIGEAEILRARHPQSQRLEVELLMAESLINLNEPEAADSTYQALYEYEKSPVVLKEWAFLDLASGKYEAAYAKLKKTFSLSPETSVWLKLLELSVNHYPEDFEITWDQGLFTWYEQDSNHPEIPIDAQIFRMEHALGREDYASADSIASMLISQNLSSKYHAQAFLVKGTVQYHDKNYEDAIRIFSMIRLLFPDLEDTLSEAVYYHVLCLWESESHKEAIMMMLNNIEYLSADRIQQLETLMGDTLDL